MTIEAEGLDLIEAFVSRLEQRPGSLAFGSGKTLRPALLRALLVSHAAQAERVRVLEGERDEARDDVGAAHAIGRFLLEAAQARIEVLEACLRCDDESVRTAWAREAKWKSRAEAAERRAGELEGIALDTAASLAAAVSLLERSPKTAAPSNKMFDQMLADYRASLDRFRALLPATQAEGE